MRLWSNYGGGKVLHAQPSFPFTVNDEVKLFRILSGHHYPKVQHVAGGGGQIRLGFLRQLIPVSIDIAFRL